MITSQCYLLSAALPTSPESRSGSFINIGMTASVPGYAFRISRFVLLDEDPVILGFF